MIKIENTNIKDVKIIKPKFYNDRRGYFFESYNQKEFVDKIGQINFIQDNESKSSFGVLRGLHFQNAPYEQSKLVRVIKGEIQDVAVDLRKNSSTYLKYVSVNLNDRSKNQLFIPKGFAHGFLVLSKYAIVAYKVDTFYSPENEVSIQFNSDKLNIDWNLNHSEIILSEKDANSKNIFNF